MAAPLWSAPGDAPADLPETGYDSFRTGLTFGDVRRLLAVEQRQVRRDTGDYMFVSRATVLGRWHEIKQDMWAGDEPPARDVTCGDCSDLVDLGDICADCGDCHDCCTCEITPQDDFWTENPWGGERWFLSLE